MNPTDILSGPFEVFNGPSRNMITGEIKSGSQYSNGMFQVTSTNIGWMKVPGYTPIINYETPFTDCIWIKRDIDDVSGYSWGCSQTNNHGKGYWITLIYFSNTLYLFYTMSSGIHNIFNQNVFYADMPMDFDWHLVTFLKLPNSKSINFYLDGLLCPSFFEINNTWDMISQIPDMNGEIYVIGCDSNENGILGSTDLNYDISFPISSFMRYDRDLPGNEILDLMNLGPSLGGLMEFNNSQLIDPSRLISLEDAFSTHKFIYINNNGILSE
jgi:hypothetical protein